MKYRINAIFHHIGYAAIVAGIVFGIKAAGLADLGGNWGEIVPASMYAASFVSLGALLAWWEI